MKPIHLHPGLSGNAIFPGSVTSQILEKTQWDNQFFSRYFDTATEGGLINFKFFFVERLFALILLIAILPVFIIVAFVIKVSSKGPIFYKQIRTGYRGIAFPVFKFRTMVVDAESQTGATLSWSGDPRITKLGSFLRKSHLDELPQLLNVIRGEMSFIGPRPERPVFTDVYNKEIQHYEFRECVRPGITGLAQICCPV